MRRSLPFFLALAQVLAACGEPEPDAAADATDADDTEADIDEPQFGDPDVDLTPFDSGARRVQDAARSVDVARGGGDGTAADGAGVDGGVKGPDGDASTRTPDTATAAPITSCAGHCGLYLEDNACHCDPNCLKNKDCCADYGSVCKCAGVADCDDANDCTTDSCINGYCKQIPLAKSLCCSSDSECPGGDVCHPIKCITGSCVAVPKDCKDDVACTADGCDLATGACTHKQQANTCIVDGACAKEGEAKPDSNGCATCQSSKNPAGWTAKTGFCAVDGLCLADKKPAPAIACASCDVAKSATAWTVATGKCLIGNTCLDKGVENPADPCLLCDPAANPTAWTAKAGQCAIDGKCVKDGTPNPGSPCLVCTVAKSKTAWTPKAGACLIDGACAAAGASDPSGCQVCDAAKSATAWTAKAAGAACTSPEPCTSGAKCTTDGQCKGTPIANCCKSADDCATMSPAPGACQEASCNAGTGKCEVIAKADCCATGTCCDAAAKTMKAKGEACNAMPPKSGTEYQCNGQAVEKRDIFAGCTGTSASKCSSDTPYKTAWTPTGKVCGPGEACTANNSNPSQSPTCKVQ